MNSDFLQILSDFLNAKSFEGLISDEIVSLARSHQVLPIIYYQTKNELLKNHYLQAISIYTQRKALLNQITEAFSDIPFYTVKGVSVSQYYPVPQLRTMGDCDIIVHESDKEKAKEKLVSIGFRFIETKRDGAEWHFEKQGLDFELHHRLLYDEVVNSEEEKSFTDLAWEYVQGHELDVNFHFVFLIIHLKKHFLDRGVGIRQFLDLVLMSKNASLEPKIIAAYLKQVGLERFAGVCSALCFRWFQIALPVDTPNISDELYYSATDTILCNGVFGFDQSDNNNNGFLNRVDKYGKLGSILNKFFPSYDDCAGTIKYKWIKGKPYLMPILWIYRLFEFLFSGRIKEGFGHISNVAKSDETIAERNELLVSWGLR